MINLDGARGAPYKDIDTATYVGCAMRTDIHSILLLLGFATALMD
jgi:hypothetical protein